MFKGLLLLTVSWTAMSAPADEKVDYLPGMDNFTFGMYSGYLDINNTNARSLHYQFAESQNNPATDPVLIWFNGGPGCSSMLGFIQEHGPYVMENDQDFFHKNQYSWNYFANVLYIESPGGVGYSTCKGDCNFTDDISASDNLIAILNWFNKFPEFKSNELYISGESYAGIYVPYVSYQLDQYITQNAGDDSVFKPNFKGFMVGNGCTNWQYDTTPAYLTMAYWHGLYDTDLYNTLNDNGCMYQFENFAGNSTAICDAAYARFYSLTSDINIYDVYGKCYSAGVSSSKSSKFKIYDSQLGLTKVGNEIKTYKTSFTAKDYTPWAFRNRGEKHLGELPPCTFGEPIIEYLNRVDVRSLLHIPTDVQQWDMCTDTGPTFNYTENSKGSQWVYEALQNKYRILFYSGDTDGAVPTYGTLGWINELNWDVTSAWRPYFLDLQVAGYVEERDGMTFATVHGAGHMVPQDKRSQAYYLISNWLAGNTL